MVLHHHCLQLQMGQTGLQKCFLHCPLLIKSIIIFQMNFKIGQITFEMSLRVNYSDLKLHIMELIKFIAQELGVNSSQVHLLKFTSKGNDSLIRWAIVPSGSDDYFSSDTALSIISRVAEHHMLLPDTFGSYELVHWNIERPTNLTWWQQHYLPVVLAIVITFILGLSASGIWLIWRRRKQTVNPYKPVDAAVPEQELKAS